MENESVMNHYQILFFQNNMLDECCMLAGQDASKKRSRRNHAKQHGKDGRGGNRIDSSHDTTSQCQCCSGLESCCKRGTPDSASAEGGSSGCRQRVERF